MMATITAPRSAAATVQVPEALLVDVLARIYAAQELLGDLVGVDEPLLPLAEAAELLAGAAEPASGSLLGEAAARGRELVAREIEARFLSTETLRREAAALRQEAWRR